jgi:hypothetical protein
MYKFPNPANFRLFDLVCIKDDLKKPPNFNNFNIYLLKPRSYLYRRLINSGWEHPPRGNKGFGMNMLLKGAALAAVATMAVASAANAATFVGTYSVDAYTGNNGLQINTQDLPGGINFVLNSIGQSSVESLFKIYTNEPSVDGGDTTPRAITVHFNFTSPTSFGGDVTGSTFGEVSGNYQNGHVTWNDPVYLAFTGGQLKVTMNDADFNSGKYGLDEGNWEGANISAKFELVGAAVPEPATWAMMIAGFGMAGAAVRRRRFAGVAA